MRVLSVEDEAGIRSLIKEVISEIGGYDVEFAVSGEEGLEKLQTEPQFDICLFDIDLPGISGIELLSRTRNLPNYADTPVIMVTSHDDERSILSAFATDATDYLSKPILPIDLQSRLHAAAQFRRGAGHGTTNVLDDQLHELSTEYRAPDVFGNFLSSLKRSDSSGMRLAVVAASGLGNILREYEPEQSQMVSCAVARSITAAAGERLVLFSRNEPGFFVAALSDREPLDLGLLNEAFEAETARLRYRTDAEPAVGSLLTGEANISGTFSDGWPHSALRIAVKRLEQAAARSPLLGPDGFPIDVIRSSLPKRQAPRRISISRRTDERPKRPSAIG